MIKKGGLDYMSKTKVKTYLTCPYSYYLKYFKKVPSVKPKAVRRGIKVHSYIENFFKQVRVKDKELVVSHIKSPVKLTESEKAYCRNFVKFEQDRWRKFSISEIRERDFKLEGFKWLKDEDVEHAQQLPEPAELVTDAIAELDASLGELNSILIALENGNNTENGK